MEEVKSKRYAVLFDIHYPKYHKAAFGAVMDFLSHNKMDGITLGGDQLDMNSISQHTKGKALYKLPGSYMQDIEGFDRDILTPLESVVKTNRVYNIGNHERFEQDLIEQQPELQGTVDHVKWLRLKERNWKVIPLGHCSKLGHLIVSHGEILSEYGNGGQYPAKKAVELYENSILCGHSHAAQSYTKISPVEHIKKHMGFISPSLCNINPSYLRNKPVSWNTGFNIVEVMPNGNFCLYQIIITGGKFSWNGVIYGK